MLLRNFSILRLCLIFIVFALIASPAFSQQGNSSSQGQDETTVEGSVISSSRTTFVVKSDDNQFHLFAFDRNTRRPRALRVGTRVRVVSNQGDQQGARYATDVTLLDQARGEGRADGSAANASARDATPIPQSVHNVESELKRDARRWRLGARAGVGLDPELVLFGLHSQMGPVFSRNIFFRPNADFEWGEVTDMVALNLEGAYRFPTAMRGGEWAPYVGAGPSLNFIHRSFQTQAGQGRNISFGNFDYETGFNIFMGAQNRHGTFFEIKTSLYSEPAPVLRLILGRTF